ncbi:MULTISPECIES: regulatory protein RecX [unclassified Microbacterium]|uniref:regulatory protein RecX n=1 Tax=unclassified Microbacterium TaxID=2609290 RepID=UPI0012FBB15A|nr:regulatory protein RecX [Microbacterium sp. MAH-37]MVQ42217.1 RecX family transcriptional regulator [Microbacterium sp. MAH-37]
MTAVDGGERDDDRLAPVIPLFGSSSVPRSRRGTKDGSGSDSNEGSDTAVPRRTGEAGLWRSSWDEGDVERPADPGARHPAYGTHARANSEGEQPATVPRLRALRPAHAADAGDDAATRDPDELRRVAEESLVRKLRSRAMSVSEARTALRAAGLEGDQADQVIDDFERRKYLDDRTLAGHLVTAGVERKGQGRVALSRALAQRGIPRDIVDDALAELPDDDEERALEYARSKARSMTRLDPDAALRRLVGQLSRRGYGGSVAMNAAKTALREAAGGSSRGVRFVESD